MQAASLVSYWQKQYPNDYEFHALGGPALRACGVKIIKDLSTQSSIGFIESLPHLFEGLFLLKEIKALFKREKYDLVLLVDGQGRNIPLGKLAKNCGLKTVYYFPPPVSIWGKWNIKAMRIHDLLLCPFEKDADLYKADGQKVVFSGHPFSTYELNSDKNLTKSELGLNPSEPVLAVFPGSRTQELKNLLPIFLEVIEELRHKFTTLQIVLPVAHPNYQLKLEQQILKGGTNIKLYPATDSRKLLMASDVLLTASGTTTLQAAFYGLPMAICYLVHPLTYTILKPLIKTNWIGLPNILAGRTICPEFINRDLSTRNLVNYLSSLLNEPEKRNKIREELLDLRKELSQPNPFEEMVNAMRALLL